MLGEKRIQDLLMLERMPLGVAKWIELKKKFKKKVPKTEALVIEAYERHNRLSHLSQGFSLTERKWLLTSIVPEALDADSVVAERWPKRSHHIITEVFLNRFETADISTLRNFLDSESTILPDGMVMAKTKLQIHHKGLDAVLQTISAAKKSTKSTLNDIDRVHTVMKKARNTKRDGGVADITASIQHLLAREATKHFHDGTSTYAEPTLRGWKGIAEALSAKPMTSDDIIVDLGSGSAATLWYLCQYHRCRGIGIEYGEARLRTAAKWSIELLKKHGKNTNFNTQVVNTHNNIMSLTAMPPCSVLYIYDEAFPDDLMDKIFELIDSAPSRLRYVLTFKANKFPEYKAKFRACRGFRVVSMANKVNKAFSAEGSSYDIYERVVDDADDVNEESEGGLYEQYWNGSLKAKIEHYSRLHDAMDDVLEKEKASRTSRLRQEQY